MTKPYMLTDPQVGLIVDSLIMLSKTFEHCAKTEHAKIGPNEVNGFLKHGTSAKELAEAMIQQQSEHRQ